jgi:hypothetical protein
MTKKHMREEIKHLTDALTVDDQRDPKVRKSIQNRRNYLRRKLKVQAKR